MSDDLVKRLREPYTQRQSRRVVAEFAAADRIEELEAKLAKAVEALESLVRDCEADYPPSHGAIKYFARTTLAELKGQNDE